MLAYASGPLQIFGMKELLSRLAGAFRAGAGAPEPIEPAALHDYLYKQATALTRPYLLLAGRTSRHAMASDARRDLDQAIGLIDRVLALNPNNWAAAWFAGKAAQRLGEPERAYGYFKTSFAIQKENPDVAREFMLTCLDTKRAPEAVEVAEHAVRLAESDAGLKANLALARLCAGDLPGAEAAIEAALAGDPHDHISITLQRLIGEVMRGERKQPQTPADLEE